MYVFPAGGQRGTTVESVIARGRGLEGTSGVHISGEGVTAKVLAIEEPSTRLRQRSANRQDQAENPNVVRFTVTIAPGAEVGPRDLWLVTPKGLTNRRVFVVGQVPEVEEVDDDSSEPSPQLLDHLPILVNGQYNQGDRDVFRFTAKAGQTLVCEVQGRKLIPFIPDAVPGWFQPCLTLYDATGRKLKYEDDFRFHPDPVLIFSVPSDGEYLLEVRDALFRGREDLIYRLAVGLLPYVTHIYPLGGRRDEDAKVRLHGVNLQTSTVELEHAAGSPGTLPVRVTANGLLSNVLPFVVGEYPEVMEREPNDTIEEANRSVVPLAINGRIGRSGDVDHFAFSAKKGQRLVMEVRGRRLESPIDSILTLLNTRGGVLAENDDTEDLSEGLITHHADSYLSYTFGADGDYVLMMRDVQAKGGEAYGYRLTITPPRSDYDLRIVPANLNVARGAAVAAKVKAYRLDGMTGEICLTVSGLPAQYVVSPAVIPAGQSETTLTITAPPDAAPGILSPTVTGTAVLAGDALAAKQSAEEAVAKIRLPLEKASAAYDKANRAAEESEAAAARSKDAAAASSEAYKTLRDVATRKQQEAEESKKELDLLLDREGKPAESRLAAATQAVLDATARKVAADTALAEARAMAAHRRRVQQAAQTEAERAKAEAERIADGGGASEEEKKRAIARAAASRKAADEAAVAVKDAEQAEEQAQGRAHAAAEALTAAGAEKAAADESWANVKTRRDEMVDALHVVEEAARAAEAAARFEKERFEKARTSCTALENAAAEQRRLAEEAKSGRDRLAGDLRAATARLEIVRKELEAGTMHRGAIPAEELMQAFYYWHDVPAQELLVAVIEPNSFTLSTDVFSGEVRELRQQSELSVIVKVSRGGLRAALERRESERDTAQVALAQVTEALQKAKVAASAAEKAARQAGVAASKAAGDAKAALAETAAEALQRADEAKAARDGLAADVKIATATVTEATKRVSEASARARAAINLRTEGPLRGITVKPVTVPADKDEAAVAVVVTNQAPVGVQQNVIITGTLKAGQDSIVQVAPAIPVRVLPAK